MRATGDRKEESDERLRFVRGRGARAGPTTNFVDFVERGLRRTWTLCPAFTSLQLTSKDAKLRQRGSTKRVDDGGVKTLGMTPIVEGMFKSRLYAGAVYLYFGGFQQGVVFERTVYVTEFVIGPVVWSVLRECAAATNKPSCGSGEESNNIPVILGGSPGGLLVALLGGIFYFYWKYPDGRSRWRIFSSNSKEEEEEEVEEER
ncbi:MAG: hypothetical protein JOS17DRAFT_801311 [Linnemannia elongata]|nr:MAG: hypothetical protein JOS17DRAFT_801311 [Linnemannia elongata]